MNTDFAAVVSLRWSNKGCTLMRASGSAWISSPGSPSTVPEKMPAMAGRGSERPSRQVVDWGKQVKAHSNSGGLVPAIHVSSVAVCRVPWTAWDTASSPVHGSVASVKRHRRPAVDLAVRGARGGQPGRLLAGDGTLRLLRIVVLGLHVAAGGRQRFTPGIEDVHVVATVDDPVQRPLHRLERLVAVGHDQRVLGRAVLEEVEVAGFLHDALGKGEVGLVVLGGVGTDRA